MQKSISKTNLVSFSITNSSKTFFFDFQLIIKQKPNNGILLQTIRKVESLSSKLIDSKILLLLDVNDSVIEISESGIFILYTRHV